MASPRTTALAAKVRAEKARKEAEGVKAQSAAVAEASRIREMFATDRRRLEKRYGVISVESMNSEVGK
jgi:hypothetical protein